MREIILNEIKIGGGNPLVLVAGPCVIESRDTTLRMARILKEISSEIEIPLIFKSSYDKANRTSLASYRGPGLEKGLSTLNEIKEEFGIPVLSDVHRFEEIAPAAEVLDVLQIPAFLSRQTDFIQEVASTNKIVNVKKGQFLSPFDMEQVIKKVIATGNKNLLVTERGTTFGYNNLVVDMRSLPIMRGFGYPVIFDATHSVQLPGGKGASSGGERKYVSHLAKSAVAAGIDGLFLEVHEDPDLALCDGPNSLNLLELKELLQQTKKIDEVIKMTFVLDKK